MGLFKNIENATATEGRNYLATGTYDISVLKVTQGETRKKIGLFGVDMKIVKSTSDLHKPDSIANWVTMSDKDGFLGNVKAFVIAILGNDLPEGQAVDETEITEDLIEEMFKIDKKTGKDAFMGQKLHVVVMQKPTLTGGTYSVHNWFSIKNAA